FVWIFSKFGLNIRRIDIIFPSIKRVWVSHPLAIGYRLTANSLNSNLSALRQINLNLTAPWGG
ncbi:MAG: hypothetical protein IJG23_03335, partial [Clostridia bacterium]|nr:hypothetical protein [Clostridia bacterium]